MRLGSIVHHIRHGNYLTGSDRDARRTRLVEMGFVFDFREAQWLDFLSALRQYKDREGHCLVPFKHMEGSYRLGETVSRIRARECFIRGNKERRQTLIAMGFTFDVYEVRWYAFLDALRAYKDREGHCNVPERHREGRYNLGAAVRDIRHKEHFVKNQPQRRCELTRYGFRFKIRD